MPRDRGPRRPVREPRRGREPESRSRWRTTCRRGAASSAAAYGTLAEFFEKELLPAAGDKDAVGRELYAVASRSFLGATVDLDETYEWGVEELQRMVDEQTSIANEIKSGASVEEAIEFLNE